MPSVQITVRDKVARTTGSPEIVCGNSDYVAVFDFDTEWESYPAKTLRTVWRENDTGRIVHADTLFTGYSVPIPPVWRTNQVLIGVYAGDIRTTTPARVPCAGCITDSAPQHSDPDDALYRQLLAYLKEIVDGGGSKPENVVLSVNGIPFEGVPENIDDEA